MLETRDRSKGDKHLDTRCEFFPRSCENITKYSRSRVFRSTLRNFTLDFHPVIARTLISKEATTGRIVAFTVAFKGWRDDRFPQVAGIVSPMAADPCNGYRK